MKKLLIGITLLVVGGGLRASRAPSPDARRRRSAAKKAKAHPGVHRRRDTLHPSAAPTWRSAPAGVSSQVLVKEGDQVKAGQPLVKLQDADQKAALAQAQADLARLQAGTRPKRSPPRRPMWASPTPRSKPPRLNSTRPSPARNRPPMSPRPRRKWRRRKSNFKAVTDSLDSITTGIEITTRNTAAAAALCPGMRNRPASSWRRRGAGLQRRAKPIESGMDQPGRRRALGASPIECCRRPARCGAGAAQSSQGRLAAEHIDAAQAPRHPGAGRARRDLLVAPFDGTITELTVLVGDLVGPGPRIASLADLTQWEVETDDLSEVDVVNVQPGAEASITVDALPGVTLKGQVKSIVPRSAVKRGDVTYTVKVAITDSEPRLKWGMTAFVDIK